MSIKPLQRTTIAAAELYVICKTNSTT